MATKKLIIIDLIKTDEDKGGKIYKIKDLRKKLSCFHFKRDEIKKVLKFLKTLGLIDYTKRPGYIRVLDPRLIVYLQNKNLRVATFNINNDETKKY